MRSYVNPWIPGGALKILAQTEGAVLDVGGGSSPYIGSSHILDIGDFSAKRLTENAWGGAPDVAGRNVSMTNGLAGKWDESQYTRFDLCSGKKWPFMDKQFDLGLCSHTLEDIRDPLSVVKELIRVSKKILVICPSRLFEQTLGVDHPCCCGFAHHLWMVYIEGNTLLFQRKSGNLYLRKCHLKCPLGKTLSVEYGAMFVYADNLVAEERVFHDSVIESEYLAGFLKSFRGRNEIFVRDGYRHNLKYWIWRFRQKYLGVL